MKKRISYLLLALTGLGFFACKKNSGGGTPVITHVRSLDSSKRDSFFVSAVPGNEIVIQGSNLQGAQAVIFNDTSASFNPVYNTNSTIIVVIPATAPTAAINPTVKNTLKVVTDHGSTTFTFTLVNPPPYINSIAFDNTGTIVYINGGNFQGVNKITFPGNDTALGYTVNKAYNQISAIIPPGSGITDSLRVFCHYGEASFPFPPPMTLTGISNENAVAGDTVLLTGTNFVRINNVTFPGGIVQSDVIPIDVNNVMVVVPPGITGPDFLHINGLLGTVATSQPFDTYITHPSPGYLSTFEKQGNAGDVDNTSFLGWTGGYASAPATAYPGGSGSVAFLTNATALGANANAGSQGNPGFVQLLDGPWVANASTSIAGYNLKFEVYVAKPWSSGVIWVMVGDWYAWHGYVARYQPWTSSGPYKPNGWVTVTIPLSSFTMLTGSFSATYNGASHNPSADNNAWDFNAFPVGGSNPTKFSDFPSTALCFAIVNDQSTPVPAGAMNIAIDNVRIVQGQ